MTKLEYLKLLENELKKRLSQYETDEIVRDYAEFFAEGASQGKTDDEMINNLGDPAVVAAQVVEETGSASRAVPAEPKGKSPWLIMLLVALGIGLLLLVGSAVAGPGAKDHPTGQTGNSGQKEEVVSAPSEVQSAASASDARPQTAAEQAATSNDTLREAARSYAETGDAESFWQVAEPALDELSALYGQQMTDSNGQGTDLTDDIRQYMNLQLEESLKEVDEDRLEKAYRQGLITKAEYHEQERTLEREQEKLEEQLDRMDRTEELLERLERNNGVVTMFVEGFDSDRVAVK